MEEKTKVELDITENMERRPRCKVPGCDNPAFVYLGGKWVCGKCAAMWWQHTSAKTFEQVVEANNGEVEYSG